MTNIFHDSTKSLPKSDNRIQRVDLNYPEMGARKSHVPTATGGKNDQKIQHVKGA